jgi:hypothetical protein
MRMTFNRRMMLTFCEEILSEGRTMFKNWVGGHKRAKGLYPLFRREGHSAKNKHVSKEP